MTGAMYAAIGGLKTHMSNLNVIGNNIANVNTNTYKAQRMTFQESIYTTSRAGSDGTVSSGGNNPSQIGYGCSVGSIDLNMGTGTYSPTGLDLDCMITSEGFFLVGDKTTGDNVTGAVDLSNFTLTRMGDFWVDPEGYVCDRRGKCVYGFAMVQNPDYNPALGESEDNPKTIVSTQLVPLRVPLTAANPRGSESFAEGDAVYNVLSSANVSNNNSRSNFSVGALVKKAYEFGKRAAVADPNATDYTFDETIVNALPEDERQQVLKEIGLSENERFSVKLDLRNGSIIGVSNANSQNAGNDYGIRLPVGYTRPDESSLPAGAGGGAAGGAGNNDPVLYTGPIPNGEDRCVKLVGMSINKQGAIVGTVEDTGEAVTLGYVAVANADANDGVTHVDGYYYKAQEGAGSLRVSALGNVLEGKYMNNKFVGPSTGGAGGGNNQNGGLTETIPPTDDRILGGGVSEIRNGGLEASTADVATEFANMILTQRGYQANTRMITVTDSMLEELVNMKR